MQTVPGAGLRDVALCFLTHRLSSLFMFALLGADGQLNVGGQLLLGANPAVASR